VFSFVCPPTLGTVRAGIGLSTQVLEDRDLKMFGHRIHHEEKFLSMCYGLFTTPEVIMYCSAVINLFSYLGNSFFLPFLLGSCKDHYGRLDPDRGAYHKGSDTMRLGSCILREYFISY